MNKKRALLVGLVLTMTWMTVGAEPAATTVRVEAAQPNARWIDLGLQEPREVLDPVNRVGTQRLAALGANTNGPESDKSALLPVARRGLAAKYPGDAGIARDAAVLWAEDFEEGSVAEIGRRWGSISNKDGKVIALDPDVPPGSPGKRSLRMTATLGENEGGHLYVKLAHGVERAFARFYVKFTEDAPYVHHFVTMGGYHPPTAWPQGGAGQKPRGDDRFTVGIEPSGAHGQFPAPGIWNFYAYWTEMKVSAGNRYWGNSITPVKPAVVPKGRWQCVEMMIQCNKVGKSDGELALWLDGELVMHIGPGTPHGAWTGMGFPLLEEGGDTFEGFRWRTDERLKVNFLWLLHYVTEGPSRQNRVPHPNPINPVWFDHVVVATEYIGPLQAVR